MRYLWLKICLALIVFAGLCEPPLQAQGATLSKAEKIRHEQRSQQILDNWTARMKRIEKLILNDKSKRALKDGTFLAAEMVNMITSGESGEILGVLNLLRAIAAYNVGDPQQALWHWHTSLQMFPSLANYDLTRFGEAEQFLRQHPVRVLSDKLQDVPQGLEGDVTPPKKTKAPQPMFPAAKLRGEPVSVVVSAIIDEEGNPTEPVIIQANGEFSLICASLEALWKWEFEPAKIDGQPISSAYNLTINFKPRR